MIGGPKILEILMYACGLKLGPAATLNQNPNFETASIVYPEMDGH
jgi:hypothetical protein